MKTHTPGPWTHWTNSLGVTAFGTDSKTPLGKMFGTEAEANARLIAAAPELLAVARMVVSFARNTRENAESTNLLYTAADAARAAIAKAAA